ncbi:MAG TPA: AprI/Inh family metalloprotease inhibitor [Xanthobacteraceae bacterium]|nr:AprI/Inh family metalloprotease inhibitor [Xanthobacteraceae bacterium]
MKAKGAGAAAAVATFVLFAGLLSGLAACSGSSLLGGGPEPNATPAPAPAGPVTSSPPVDLAGRWQLSAAAGGACSMNFADAPGAGAQSPAPQGTIAPAGGCPGNFFMSRKWAFENGMLVIHDFKGKPLAQMSYVGGHFEGHDASGSALTLSKQL